MNLPNLQTMEDSQRAPINIILTGPSDIQVGYWITNHLGEACRGLNAHMELYSAAELRDANIDASEVARGGNMGQWDADSSWGALQKVQDELAAYTLKMLIPINPLKMVCAHRCIRQVLADYVMLSDKMPLVLSGAATRHSKAKYAKLLTVYLKTCTDMLTHPDPLYLLKKWKSQRFL